MELFLWAIGIILVIVWLGIVLVGPPYVPTHKKQLDTLFDELQLGADDHVVDLGSGDGRVLLAATQRGAAASGVELNPFLVWIARFRLRRQPRAKVRLGDIWRYHLPSDTTYVFVFFAHKFMPRLERFMQIQDRRVRLVSYGFSLPGKKPVQIVGGFNIYEL